MTHRDCDSYSETRVGTVTRFEFDGLRVYQIPVQNLDQHFTNTYLVLDGGTVSLIDVGFHGQKPVEDFMAGLAAVNRDFGEDVGPGDVAHIVVTHGHDDHFGMLSCDALKGRPLYMALPDSLVVTDYPGEDRKWRESCRRMISEAGCSLAPDGLFPGIEFAVGPGDYDLITVADGERIINGYGVVGTPGHTPGHICLRVGPVLFLGDHILSVTSPHQTPRTSWGGAGLAVYLGSLRKVAALGVALGLPGHEDTIYSVRDRAEEIERFHRARLADLEELCRGGKTLYDLTDAYYQRHPELIGASSIGALEDSELVMALEEIKAHLEYLVEQGRVGTRSGSDGVVTYASC